jgi:hypothetical protein
MVSVVINKLSANFCFYCANLQIDDLDELDLSERLQKICLYIIIDH